MKMAIIGAMGVMFGSACSAEDVDLPAEVVVTAQKRDQRLIEVPMAVTALSERRLQDAGVRDIKDLSVLVPGLIVTSTSSEAITTARIRGIGTVGDNPGLESSVGVVIDGVYRPRNGVGFGDLGELERIEVLKGPQGTLFGKNASAGVINIVTRQPAFEFGSQVELTTGDYGAREASASLTGPLVGDKIAGRLYAAQRTRDGFNDVNTGSGSNANQEDVDRDFTSVRGQLLWVPIGTLDIHLTGDYSERKEHCCTAVQLNVGATAPLIDALAVDSGVANPADPFARRVFSNRPTPQEIEDRGLSVHVQWKVPALRNAHLTSMSAYREWEFVSGVDADYSTADILFRAEDGRYGTGFKHTTQELRLTGNAGALDWLVGAFYAHETLDSRYHLGFGSAFEPYYGMLFSQGTVPGLVSAVTGLSPGAAYPLSAGLYDRFHQRSDSIALLTHNTLAITERLGASLGLRYTHEIKELDSQYSNIGGGSAGCAASRARRAVVNAMFASAPAGTAQNWFNIGCNTFADPAFDAFTSQQRLEDRRWSGTANVTYRVRDAVMGYVSYARGHKAGGFNLDRARVVDPALGAADPGAQADPDTRFGAEVADAFEMGIKSSWLGERLVMNAAVFDQAFKDFQLNAFTGISYVVTSVPEVTSQGVDLDVLWAASRGLSVQGGVTYAETEYGEFVPGPGVSARLPGNAVSFAPRWSGSLSATYGRPVGERLQWRANVSGKVTSRYNTGSDLNPAKAQDGFGLVNARVGLGSRNERWMVEAWALNVSDRAYYQVVIDAPLQGGTLNGYLGAPRTWGMTVRGRF